ncbi:MAG: hypothetical protein JWQ44_2862, partial [Chthoniobacter sp.]|nr:hypothetical protein [Chthoniobacter sp.]
MKLTPVFAALFAFAPLLLAENEVGFIEKFALAKDREAVLQQLVPGTEDYYFYHALHFQNSKQPAKLAAIMQQWANRFKDSEQRKIIENRAAMLAYDANPQQTLAFLRDRLQVQFHHVQEVRDQKPNLPTTLDQARIARPEFLKQALLNNDDLGQFTEETLEALVRQKTPITPAQRRALLSKLNRPDLPGLVELIAAELTTPENRQFGEFPIHKALLPEQLEALLKLVPVLSENEEFVLRRLRKLAPSADADIEFDPVARDAWLTRAWDYAKTLPPAFPTVKATILRQRLEFDRTRGVHDKALFLEYLKLPRRLGYVNPRSLAPQTGVRPEIDLNRGFTDAALPLPPIGDDEALVRSIFLHLFATEEAWEPYASLVRDTWLKPVFAEAKILSGIGNPDRWAALLTPAEFQALKDRVDIEFPATNPPFLATADEVTVGVTIKNTPKLIVKIYEINTLAFFMAQKRPLNTDLNLDGLVANSEQTHEGEASPFRRVTRSFQFPELKGKRGAWIIEFIGGGKSSRALIRKGQFKVLPQSGPAGDLLTVLDEANAPVPGAAVWADGRRYTAVPPAEGKPADPRILVPFTAQPGRKQIVLADADGGFSSLAEFEHHGESYQLDAQFHIEREQLLAGREAKLGIRTALLLGEARVALDLLQETRLLITSTTLDGIATTTEVKSPKLMVGQVFTHTITVPERLAKLTATLTGKVDLLTKGGEKQDLSASHSWEINGIDRTNAVSDGHLSKFGENYVFELLGKNGEPLPDQQVVLRLKHFGFSQPITVALRTDEKGRVTLGALAEIAHVESELPYGRKGTWYLKEFQRTWPTVIHGKAGEKVELPWASELKPGSYSLLEVRGGEFVADRSDRIIVPPAAAAAQPKPPVRLTSLPIQPLEPGDYSLRLRDEGGESREMTIRVTAGDRVGNWLLAPNRSLELRDVKPLHIDRLQATDAGVTVKLVNWNPFTRVHVAATRFLPSPGIYRGLAGFTRFAPTFGTPDKLPNLFSSGRAI